MKLKVIHIIFFLFVIIYGCISQSMVSINYTIDDGLPSNNVYQALQDKKGYMWFATEGGVARFNGKEFKNFTVNDGLPTNDVYHIVEDVKGRIWIQGASRVVSYIAGDSVFICKDLIDSNYYNDLSKLSYVYLNDDNIEITYRDFTCLVDSNLVFSEYRRTKNDSYKKTIMTTLGITKKRLSEVEIIISDEHYLVIEGKEIHLFNDKVELIGSLRVSFLLLKGRSIRGADNYKHENQVYIPTIDKNSLMVMDINSLNIINEINVSEILGATPTHLRYARKDSTLQVQTNVGVFEIDLASGMVLTDMVIKTVDYSIKSKVNRVFQDADHNIWISTQTEGVKVIPNYFRSKGEYSSGYNFTVQSIAEAQDDIYIGSYNGIVNSIVDQETQLNYQFNEADERINKIIYNENNHQLNILKDGQGLVVYDIQSKKSENILDFEFHSESKNGTYTNRERLENDFGVSSHYIVSPTSAVLHNGYIYMGSSTYLFKVDATTYHLDKINYSKSRGLVVADSLIYKMNDNSVQLTDLNFENIKTYSFNLTIKEIVKHENGILVLLDNGDLYRVNVLEKVLIKYHHIRPSIARRLFIDDGIWIASDQALFQYVIDSDTIELDHFFAFRGVNDLLIKQDSIYIASEDGFYVNSIGDSDIPFISAPIFLHVEDVLKHRPLSEKNTLEYDENNLKLTFDVLEYSNLGDFRVNVTLIAEDTLSLISEKGEFVFPNLSPNTYKLDYYVTDYLDRRSETNSLVFKIKPPWYSTFWFYLLSLIFILFLAFIVYSFTTKRIRKKEQNETLVNKRMAELQLTALQSQMNPHFIFNSLNSIQYLIQIEDSKSADVYLSKFSDLLRSFLENSIDKYTSVSKEVDLLLNYCNLEKLRFENKFEVIYTNDLSNVEREKYLIPTNILQPLIENAINHGLFHKADNGILKIKFSLVDFGIKITVEDNGIGREASSALKIKGANFNRSIGTSIVQQKLDVLKKIDDFNVSLVYFDLKDENGASGTRVILRFPIKEKPRYE